jgi:hypothetical protein
MRINIPVNLAIQPSKGPPKEMQKALEGIQTFMRSMPIIMQEFMNRAEESAKDIAPVRTGDLSESIRAENNGEFGFKLVADPGDYDERVKGWKIGSRTRAMVMEFGYPYRNDFWKAPYHPTPRPGFTGSAAYTYPKEYKTWKTNLSSKDKKSGKAPKLSKKELDRPLFTSKDTGEERRSNKKIEQVKYYTVRVKAKQGATKLNGLGYLRVSYIIAARSMYTDKTSYSRSGLSLSAVSRYVTETEKEFSKSMTKLLVKYLQNKPLPRYLTKAKAQRPATKLNLGSKVSYGSVSGLTFEIPIEVATDDRFMGMRSGLNLLGADRSLVGQRPAVEGFEYNIGQSGNAPDLSVFD